MIDADTTYFFSSPPFRWREILTRKENVNKRFLISLLIIPALAITITLCYASLLDIRERRVPFRTWYPMLAFIIPVSTIVFGLYLLNLDNIQFVTFILLILAIASGLLGFDYYYTKYRYEVKPTRKDVFTQGIYWLLFSIPVSSLLYGFLTGTILVISIVAVIFCALVYIFGIYLYGGADSFALLAIGVGIPLFPVEPLCGYPLTNYFPWSAFLNALVLNIIAPVGIFLFNRYRSNNAPLRYQFLGFPVKGDEIQNTYGFVMEVIEEKEGVMQRRFLTFREIMGSIFSRSNRIYTKDLKTAPDKYHEELKIFKKAGTVWISYGVPFIVPITAGLISAIFIGDIIFIIMKFVAGF
ncbi:MAG: peptidase A24 [Methanoregulaceae archaeon]|nr:peptidase A24 [Methanoregulaceae archaeon]